MTRFSLLLLILLLPVACNRQYEITINDRSVYDPRVPRGAVRVDDPNLQGCVNLALTQLGPASGPEELTILICQDAQVASLDGIERLTGLRFLDLSRNTISDLTVLSTLNELSVLIMPDNRLTEISSLLNMPRLTNVDVSGNARIACPQLNRLQESLGQNLTRPLDCR